LGSINHGNSNSSWEHGTLTINSPNSNGRIQGNFALDDSPEKIVYRGCDGFLHQLNINGSVANYSIIGNTSNISEKAAINSEISIDQSSGSVYYPNFHSTSLHSNWIYQYWLNNGIFNSAYLSSTFPSIEKSRYNTLNTDTQVGNLAVNSSSGAVFYANQQGALREYYWSNTWVPRNVDALNSSSNFVCGDIVVHNNSKNIFYIGCSINGSNQTIRNVWWNNALPGTNKWVFGNLGQIANIPTKGNIAVDQSNSSLYFRSNTDQFVYQYWFNHSNSTWNYAILTNTYNPEEKMLENGDITVDNNTGAVYYVGADEYLHQYRWNGSQWIHSSLQKNNNTPDTEEKVQGDIAVNSITGRVYFKGKTSSACDNVIHFYEPKCKQYGVGPEPTNEAISRERNELIDTRKIDVFPNPFNESLSVTISDNLVSDYSIQMFDNIGNLVKSVTLVSNSTVEFNTSNLPQGIYFIRIIGKNGHCETIKAIH
jgi:hypothetical protein